MKMGKGRYDDMDTGKRSSEGRRGGRFYLMTLFILLLIALAFISYLVFSDKNEEELIEEIGENPLLKERYVVKEGDTYSSIAAGNEIAESTLESINGNVGLEKGLEIIIPPSDGVLFKADSIESLSGYLAGIENHPPLEIILLLNELDEDSVDGKYVFIPLEAENANKIDSSDEADTSVVENEEERVEESALTKGFAFPLENVVPPDAMYSFGSTYDGVVLDGTGYPITPGEMVIAIDDGVVTKAGTDEEGKKGRYVTIRHNDGFESTYYSLEVIGVTISDEVRKGDVIATIGRSADYFPTPMLYFVLKKDGVAVDSREYF